MTGTPWGLGQNRELPGVQDPDDVFLRTRNASLTRFTLFFLIFILAVMYLYVNHRAG